MLRRIPYAPSMTDQLERTTNLLALLLETRVPLTLDDIVNQLAGQYPTGHTALRGAFERDKGLLRDIGVPIETEVLGGTHAGQTAYRVDRDRYELRGLDLTDDERRALQVAVAAARTTEAEFGMLKLGGVADSAASITANLPQLELLPPLREAIAARSEVSFSYHDAPRTLQPYGLLLREGFWYVIGHDLGHHEVRTYRVDRIEGSSKASLPGSSGRTTSIPEQSFPPTRKSWATAASRQLFASTTRARHLPFASSATSRLFVDWPTAVSRSRCRAATSMRSARGCSAGVCTPRSCRRPTCAVHWSTGCGRWRAGHDPASRPTPLG
jgi:proteasome accessory factor B